MQTCHIAGLEPTLEQAVLVEKPTPAPRGASSASLGTSGIEYSAKWCRVLEREERRQGEGVTGWGRGRMGRRKGPFLGLHIFNAWISASNLAGMDPRSLSEQATAVHRKRGKKPHEKTPYLM